MLLHFTKMHGLGNDFVIIDGVRQNFTPTAELIRQFSDRRTGIGFDQLLIVEPARNSQTDFFYRIFNADGHEVEQCGNGARCVARFLHHEKLTTKNPMQVETLGGNLELKIENDSQVTVMMGIPNFNPAMIPFIAAQQASVYTISLAQQNIEFSALSLGNPHCVILVDDVDQAPVTQFGSALNHHSQFPKGVNVGFMQILNPNHIRLRVYERGAEETLACGSGACAAVIIGNQLKLLKESVRVDQSGGPSQVTWPNNASPVYLTGPAVCVFKGSISI